MNESVPKYTNFPKHWRCFYEKVYSQQIVSFSIAIEVVAKSITLS